MKYFFKKRLSKFHSSQITVEDIKKAKSILFASFSRYGDAIISYQIIKELINKYPNKDYLLVTTYQHLPYAKEILKDENIEIVKFNKRNIFDYIKLLKIKNFNANLGFNPWSHGDDSKFIITYASKFQFFGDLKFSKIDNLYDRVRIYFHLPVNDNKSVLNIDLNNVKNIVFAPYSTDVTKNLSKENINTILQIFKDKEIILALPKDEKFEIKTKKFIFSKKNSEQFLKIMKKSDLFIGVDSGPLHIAIALNKPIIGVFGPTSPLTILNNSQKIKIIRSKKLKGYFCFYRDCKKPKCIENIIKKDFLNIGYKLENNLKLITDKCIYER